MKNNGLIVNFRKDTFDVGIIGEVITHDCYRIKNLELPKNARIIDVGGQIGTFAVYAGKKFPDAEIISVEMMAENYDFLVRNTKDFKNIKTINAAVIGGRPVKGRNVSLKNTGGHSVCFTDENINNSDAVNQVCISDLFDNKKVDFLKMDCEASEYDILKKLDEDGLMKLLNIISMEYHLFYGHSLCEITDILDKNNFKYEAIANPKDKQLGMLYAKNLKWSLL